MTMQNGTSLSEPATFADLLIDASLYFLRSADLKGMSERLIRGACLLLRADFGLVAAIDSAAQPELLALHPGAGPVLLVDAHRIAPLWLMPMELRRRVCLTAEDSTMLPAGIEGYIGLPLFNQEELVGVIGLARRSGCFRPERLDEVEAFAGMAALAIRSAHAQLAEKQALEELRQAQKMEALGQLAAGIAHDFNNMLTVIHGYGTQIGHTLPETAATREDLAILLDAASKAADLSRQLLAFSRCQMLSPRTLDLNSLVRNMHKLLKRIMPEDIHIALLLDQDIDYIRADPGQIEQILMNLMINARDAMPAGGSVTIHSGNAQFGTAFTEEHKGSIPGAYAWFSLTDTGEGIDPADLPHIFQPFFTTKALGKGTGLGLATVYGAVKQSGGYITVDSSPGRGSRFTVYLPSAESTPAAEEHPGKSAGKIAGGTLLLVEDDPEVLRLMAKVLQIHGFTVLSTSDPEQARELFESHREAIDLLVTDMVMPNLSGPLLAKLLLQERPELPVLFISGYGQVTFKTDFTCGVTGEFLAKPFSPGELLQAVLASLRSRSAGESC